MQRNRLCTGFLFCFSCCLLGCTGDLSPAENHNEPVANQSHIASSPSRITNKLGMTFCLVAVDIQHPYHQTSFPTKSFYLQETELTAAQFSAYAELVQKQSGSQNVEEVKPYFPQEWRDVANLATQLSKLDAQYNYRLPTRAEWMFACKNGYDQTSPGSGSRSTIYPGDSLRPNKFGIDGLMNSDAECADEPGLVVGIKSHSSYLDPDLQDCRCEQYRVGNPDADDDLNELIVARFVLEPK